MKVVGNDGLVVGGNDYAPGHGNAFVARLLGDAAGGSPGVLGMKQERFLGTEQGAQAVLTVRRTGGSAGAVAVTYATRDFPAPPADWIGTTRPANARPAAPTTRPRPGD